MVRGMAGASATTGQKRGGSNGLPLFRLSRPTNSRSVPDRRINLIDVSSCLVLKSRLCDAMFATLDLEPYIACKYKTIAN